MAKFGYLPPRTVDQRHRAAASRLPMASPRGHPNQTIVKRPSVQRNVQPVLDLGGMRYMTIGGSTYRCPSVPFKLGEKVLNTFLEATSLAQHVAMGGPDGRVASKGYYDKLTVLANLLWSHIQPLGKFNRLCWHCGLSKNPLRQLSEKELQDVTNFFLAARTRSSVQFTSERPGKNDVA